jgi:Ca-activated chloride channel family protein
MSRVVCWFTAVLLMAATASPQSGRRFASGQNKSDDEPLKLRAEEVLLNVTVNDPYGHQATDLRKSEFIIAEEGQRQQLASFHVARVPVNVVFLLDASGSVIGELSSLRDAAKRFIEQLGPEDKGSVMEFHLKVQLLQDWTSNQDDLLNAISWKFKPGAIPRTGGNTSLYDSVFIAADEQLAKVEGRRAIIILTDGDDNSSKRTYDEALAAVIRSGAVVYVVSKARMFIEEADKYRHGVNRVLGGGSMVDRYISEMEKAERIMTDLATRTGGQILSPMKDDETKDVYARVAQELKSQYVITYIPTNDKRDGGLRHVKVYLTRPGYAARTRDSYYAPRG